MIAGNLPVRKYQNHIGAKGIAVLNHVMILSGIKGACDRHECRWQGGLTVAKQSKCELVRKGEVKHIPKDWNDKGNPNCVGFIDSYRDTELPECKSVNGFGEMKVLTMTEETAERIGYSKGYADGREELAKMLIKRFDPDRPPTSEGAYYYKDEIIEIIKEMAGVDDESKA